MAKDQLIALRDIRCADEACDHPLAEHGADGYCYGLRTSNTGRIINCVCKKFRMPLSTP